MMPHAKHPRDTTVTSLWNKAEAEEEKQLKRDPCLEMENQATTPNTQEFLSQFLQQMRSEIGSLKTDFKTRLHDLPKEVTELGDRVSNLGHATDALSEDQEMLWCRMAILEEQQIELQIKPEDLENGK
ncbi:hypothetical protein NDU88_001367 [Pleurodeles waltl]|uniref:Uncharacterized protein n=1 Tax=Pleurodeles waltl TaxID=8319 RepID=A0AAV7Q5Q1_PLEWA|nr:hypothetical protein NDU88_001367 [Pleurodeles waltl]